MFNTNLNINRFGGPSRLLTYGSQVESFVQNGYQILKFYYQSGSTDPINGTGSFILPDNREVEFFVVAGGGTGGVPGRGGGFNFQSAQYSAGAAGGGAGAVITGSFYGLKGQQYNVIAGAGGFRAYGTQESPSGDAARNGAPSIITGTSAAGAMTILTPGGGHGGAVVLNTSPSASGADGGSGGGAGALVLISGPYIELIGNSGSIVPVTASGVIAYTAYQNVGGLAADSGAGTNILGVLGAGGGATVVGGNGDEPNSIGGNGGAGISNAISGSGQYFAGGGAGGYITQFTGYFGLAGQGGGGGATNTTTEGPLGFALGQGVEQTGGGGAAAYSGGSGVVILKYRVAGISLNGTGAA